MSRYLRRTSRAGIYHVVARGNNQQVVFREEADFRAYREFLDRYHGKHVITIHHYCLMDNHVHLLVNTADLTSLSCFMHDVQRSFSLYRQKKETLSGHIWQGRFGSFPIEDESYLLECGRYIERNPVRAGIVENPEDYPWSSYRHYAYGTRDSLVTVSPVYLALGLTEKEREFCYRRYAGIARPGENLKSVPGTLYPVPNGV